MGTAMKFSLRNISSPLAAATAALLVGTGLGAVPTAMLLMTNPLEAVILAAMGGAVFITGLWSLRRVHQALAICTDILKGSAKGQLEDRLLMIGRGGDPLSRLAWAINSSLDATDAFVREAEASLNEVTRYRFHRRLVERGMHGGYANSARAINAMTESLEGKFHENRQFAVRFRDAIGEKVQTSIGIARETHHNAERMEAACGDAVIQSESVLAATRAVSDEVETVAAATDGLAAA
ncbi:MAG: hypothetical protein K2X44_01620, partial [Magnetospirillum sp.]|nr:hypothetical protein [Magnetospirillum sp.]